MKSKPKKIWIPFFTRSEDLTHTRSEDLTHTRSEDLTHTRSEDLTHTHPVHINTLQFPYDLADLTHCIGNHNTSVDTSFATIFEF